MISDADATIELPVMREPARRQPDERPRAGRALALASVIVAATYFGSRVLGALRTTAVADQVGTAVLRFGEKAKR